MLSGTDYLWALGFMTLGLIETYWNRTAFEEEKDTWKSLYKVRFVFGVILALGSILVILANLLMLV
ncbi:hypothetical protein [Maribacter sp. 2210JD10-5]|uniref:hypothetical protein n=1 Tax=Maribacter sp. 2210JD10-5 TaxID=3386272 RepID=UPI0039BC79A3